MKTRKYTKYDIICALLQWDILNILNIKLWELNAMKRGKLVEIYNSADIEYERRIK